MHVVIAQRMHEAKAYFEDSRHGTCLNIAKMEIGLASAKALEQYHSIQSQGNMEATVSG